MEASSAPDAEAPELQAGAAAAPAAPADAAPAAAGAAPPRAPHAGLDRAAGGARAAAPGGAAPARPPRLAYADHLAAAAPQSAAALCAAAGDDDEARRLPANVQPSLLQARADAAPCPSCLAAAVPHGCAPLQLRTTHPCPPPSPRHAPQLKQLQGLNDLAAVLAPPLAPDGLPLMEPGGNDLGAAAGGGGSGERAGEGRGGSGSSGGGVAQFRFELVRAAHVGPTGFGRERPPVRATARVGILDRQHHRFLGNVHEMPPAAPAPPRSGGAWSWRADAGGAVVVRCARAQVRAAPGPRDIWGSRHACAKTTSPCNGSCPCHPLSAATAGAIAQPDPTRGVRAVDPDRVVLLVELNVALPLTAEDVCVLPAQESRVRMAAGWAGRCAQGDDCLARCSVGLGS
jgi:hypothetical protein